MSGYETIEVTTTDHVMTLTLNRPDVPNAFNDAFSTEMSDALKSCERDLRCQVLVITGSGRAFSSGQDLEDLKKKYVPGHVPELCEDLRRRYDPITAPDLLDAELRHRPSTAWRSSAGCSLPLACDLRVAFKHASFIEVFVNVGLALGFGEHMDASKARGHGASQGRCASPSARSRLTRL